MEKPLLYANIICISCIVIVVILFIVNQYFEKKLIYSSDNFTPAIIGAKINNDTATDDEKAISTLHTFLTVFSIIIFVASVIVLLFFWHLFHYSEIDNRIREYNDLVERAKLNNLSTAQQRDLEAYD